MRLDPMHSFHNYKVEKGKSFQIHSLHSIIGNLDSVRHEQRWEYPLADNREWRGMGVRLFYDEVGVELIEEKIATIKEYE